MPRAFVVAWIWLGLAACSTIMDGTSQKIVVNTVPAGAECVLSRQGAALARIEPTPGEVTVTRTKDDITIDCGKSGYQQTTFLNHSGLAATVFANIAIPGGSIGLVIDSMTGAFNQYDDQVNLTLVPVAKIARVAPTRVPRTAEPAAMRILPSSPPAATPSAPAAAAYEVGPVFGL